MLADHLDPVEATKAITALTVAQKQKSTDTLSGLSRSQDLSWAVVNSEECTPVQSRFALDYVSASASHWAPHGCHRRSGFGRRNHRRRFVANHVTLAQRYPLGYHLRTREH